jgi:hypothetical protein
MSNNDDTSFVQKNNQLSLSRFYLHLKFTYKYKRKTLKNLIIIPKKNPTEEMCDQQSIAELEQNELLVREEFLISSFKSESLKRTAELLKRQKQERRRLEEEERLAEIRLKEKLKHDRNRWQQIQQQNAQHQSNPSYKNNQTKNNRLFEIEDSSSGLPSLNFEPNKIGTSNHNLNDTINDASSFSSGTSSTQNTATNLSKLLKTTMDSIQIL